MLSLAPFQGITDAVFRNVYQRHFKGIDRFYTPFFTGIQKDNSKNLREEEIGIKYNDVNITVPQILSADAEEIIRFAKYCKSLGYKEINLNMGCPFPRVANKVRGCGMMTQPEKVRTILTKVFDEIDIALSIKCRLGYYKAEEIYDFIDIFNTLPFCEVIIHPRIGKQLYSGNADIAAFKKLIPLINKNLVYNGDINDVVFFEKLKTEISETEDFMLGRGLLTNPFLAEKIRNLPPAPNEKQRLHDFMYDIYLERLRHAGGSPKVLGRMKELWSYTMNIFDNPTALWRKIKKINDLNEYETAVEEIFRDMEINL